MANPISPVTTPVAVSFPPQKTELIERVGLAVSRYGLVFLLVMWGGFKFTSFEAKAVQPFISHSPFMSWMYAVTSTQGASDVIGVVEMATGLSIATRRWSPLVSGYASLVASGIFLLTLSFLFTTPGVTDPSNPAGGFLMKDILLFGAALVTAGEALGTARRRWVEAG